MSDPTPLRFLAHFAALGDPRQSAKVVYPLPEILLLLLCATISGADDFVESTLWGEARLDFLRRFEPCQRGIPSHDTLCDVIAAIDPETFKACFLAWVETLRSDTPDMIAIDGKTARRSHAGAKGRLPLHTVSAWTTRQRLVLGQEAVAEKSNEINAIPQTITDRGGDHLLALKENWPATHAAVELLFAEPPPEMVIRRGKPVDGDHGRIETRNHAICHDVDWMFSSRRFPDEFRFPGLAALGMIESETERGDKIERQTSYFLGSAKLDVETFAAAKRGHWGIENGLHWILDVVFHDDLARLRTGHGPANMAIIRHTALNLLNQAKPVTSLKNRRKKAGRNQNYLEKIIRRTA